MDGVQEDRDPISYSISDDNRVKYLIEWRQGLWTQIRQKEDGIWRFMSFYAGAIVLAAGATLSRDAIPGTHLIVPILGAILIILVVTIVTFWGLLIVLDANYWLQRNLIFVSNIEKIILRKEDFGSLIPKSFGERERSRFTTVFSYEIHIDILLIVLLIALFAYTAIVVVESTAFDVSQHLLSAVVSVSFVAGLRHLLVKDWELIQKFVNTQFEAPGKIPRSINRITYAVEVEVAQVNNYETSHLSKRSWLATLLVFCLLLFAVLQPSVVEVFLSAIVRLNIDIKPLPIIIPVLIDLFWAFRLFWDRKTVPFKRKLQLLLLDTIMLCWITIFLFATLSFI